MTMIDKVSAAIGEKLKPVVAGSGTVKLGDIARAAIEAMREPTEEMDDAGARAHQKKWADAGIMIPLEQQLVSFIFAAMIDAALKE